MTDPSYIAQKSVGPVEQQNRIETLDVLRGFALMGILMVNIQAFAMISASIGNPTSYGDFTGFNYYVWLITHVFFESKFMTLFSVLFGAGIILMAERILEKGKRAWWIHIRRMFWLILIGMLHGYGLWFGDILFSYGATGLIVYWLRRLGPVWLTSIGLLMVAVPVLINLFFGWSMQYWPDDAIATFSDKWHPGVQSVSEELEAYRGDWWHQMKHRVPMTFMFQTFLFLIYSFWRAGGLMLIGMAFYKWGIITGRKNTHFYLIGGVVGALVALPAIGYGVHQQWAHDWAYDYSMFYGTLYNNVASLFLSFSLMCWVILFCRWGLAQRIKRAMAAMGQMALTNYLLQTIICTSIFYGHGLGWFGSVERWQQFCIVMMILALQLIVSPFWLQRFRFGPVEWLWRSLTYWRVQPILKETKQKKGATSAIHSTS